MIRHRRLYASLSLAALLLSGCASGSTNPREGGLFGYNPTAYEQRQQERQARLTAIEADQRREAAQSASLDAHKQDRAGTIARQQEELRGMEASFVSIKRKLATAKAATAEQEQQLAALRQRAATLESGVKNTENGADTKARKEHLQKLRKEMAKLQRDMDALLAK